MPCYMVTNRITKEKHEVEAPSAQAACEKAGWLIGHCHVVKLTSPTAALDAIIGEMGFEWIQDDWQEF